MLASCSESEVADPPLNTVLILPDGSKDPGDHERDV